MNIPNANNLTANTKLTMWILQAVLGFTMLLLGFVISNITEEVNRIRVELDTLKEPIFIQVATQEALIERIDRFETSVNKKFDKLEEQIISLR